MDRKVAVLGFHKIGKPADGSYPSWNYIPTSTFREQINLLRAEGWEWLTVDAFVAGLAQPESLPERSALITFDDGYRSTFTEALPCLLEFGAPAVIFVPTAFVGGCNEFDRDIEPEEALCTWEELRHLEENGVSVEAHSVTHPHLSELEQGAVVTEIGECKQAIERMLGSSVRLFAYPYGDAEHDLITDHLMRASGYVAAFGYGGGIFDLKRSAPRYRIPRLAMGPDTDILELLA